MMSEPSDNAHLVGLLGYAVDSERRRRLHVEVIPSVRVTEYKPDADPVHVPATNPSPVRAVRCVGHKVL